MSPAGVYLFKVNNDFEQVFVRWVKFFLLEIISVISVRKAMYSFLLEIRLSFAFSIIFGNKYRHFENKIYAL